MRRQDVSASLSPIGARANAVQDTEQQIVRPNYSDEAAIEATLGWLTQDPGSPFTNALAILRHTADGYVALKNDCLRSVTATSDSEQRITSADHLADTFNTIFNLDVPKSRRVWGKIQALGRDEAA